jgi:alpha-galactosidase
MSRQEVRDYLFDALSAIFSTVPISYIKWDMNRSLTEIGSSAAPAEAQGEIAHRYMLGVYELIERLTSAFPHILFESCSSGGGRFDPGMLYYMPQTWTSDNTDAVERLKIQWMFVSEDRSEAIVFFFKVLAEPFAPQKLLRLKGLDPDRNYVVNGDQGPFGGDRLLNVGLAFQPPKGDYASLVF